MRPLTVYLLLLAPLLSPAQDPIAARLTRLHASDLTDCVSETLPTAKGAQSAPVIREYRTSRHLPDDRTARLVLTALLDYQLRPSQSTFDALRRRHIAAGAQAEVAEDIARCVYFLYQSDDPRRVQWMASIPPATVGFYWAGRILYAGDRAADSFVYYQRVLDADANNPRTRLTYGVALLGEGRASDALAMFEGIGKEWAPQTVAYWRARALLALGRGRDALALLEVLPREIPAEASTDAGRVYPAWTRCALGEALAVTGEPTRARELLTQHEECTAKLAELELQQNRPFEALVATMAPFGELESLSVRVEALARLGACEWARRVLRDQDGARWVTVRSQVTSLCPARDASIDATPDERLATRIAAPRIVPFEERPIPSAWRWRGARPEEPSVPPYRALEPFAVVAVSPVAQRMFAVSVSHDVDPRGEVSAGGYWLHLTSDRGLRWEGPYYLGFAHQFPYVVQSASRVPAFAGDVAQIEVERREVDESSIMFPPIGLRTKGPVENLVLHIDLNAVRRDSDGDGLTDLLEEKLLLDSHARDTDGDGLDDGDDPVALVSRANDDTSDVGRLWAVLLPRLFGGVVPIQQSAAAVNERSEMTVQSRPFASQQTLFLEGPRCLVPHAARVRAVCLSSELFGRYRAKFGATYPLFPDVAFDRERKRALVQYDFGWRGGVILATWKEGDWAIEEISSWIS